jgi:acyl-coenzyme A thioesterase 13
MSETTANPLLDMLQARVGEALSWSPSPTGRWLNGTLEALHDDGGTVAYVVREEMVNPAGVLHGGMATAMMDDVVGMTLMVFSGGRFHASINLSVDFLAPARVGDRLRARSRIVRQGRRLANAECTLTAESGTLVARATTNLLAVGE